MKGETGPSKEERRECIPRRSLKAHRCGVPAVAHQNLRCLWSPGTQVWPQVPAQWIKGPVLVQLWCSLQLWLGSDLIPALGTPYAKGRPKKEGGGSQVMRWAQNWDPGVESLSTRTFSQILRALPHMTFHLKVVETHDPTPPSQALSPPPP